MCGYTSSSISRIVLMPSGSFLADVRADDKPSEAAIVGSDSGGELFAGDLDQAGTHRH